MESSTPNYSCQLYVTREHVVIVLPPYLEAPCYSTALIVDVLLSLSNLSLLIWKHSGNPVSLHFPPSTSFAIPGAQVKIRAIPENC
jgi:hypothetical protein